MNFVADTVLASSSNLLSSSLDGLVQQNDQDVCFVQNSNRYYRWYASSATVANGTTVVIPRGQDAAVAGRWFVQGPPGQGAAIKTVPAALQGSFIKPYIAAATPATLSGGADKVLASLRIPIIENQILALSYVVQGQAVGATTMSAWIRPGSGGPVAETISIRALGISEYYNFSCIKRLVAPAATFYEADLMFANGTEDFTLAFGAIFAFNLGLP